MKKKKKNSQICQNLLVFSRGEKEDKHYLLFEE